MPTTDQQPVSLRELFRYRAFAVLFPAEIISVLGTQLARFALMVLVFDRTDSAAAAALTYATSFLPAAIGGVLLGRLGDRYPRRRVMIVADLLRAGLFIGMAVPGAPLALIVAMLTVAVLLDPAFAAAQVSYLADELPPEQFRASAGWRATADQTTQVAGFAVGGAVVGVLGAEGSLVIDAATFLASASAMALLLRRRSGGAHRRGGVRAAPRRTPGAQAVAMESSPGAEPATVPEPAAVEPAFRGLWRDSRTRLHMVFTVLVGLYVLPEALAVSYGKAIGASTAQSGVLLAMIPLGSAIGSALVIRLPHHRRRAVSGVMALACGLPLMASAAEPGWAVSCACWFLAGLLTGYEVEVISGLVTAVPASARATLLGIISAWLVGSQGVSFALGGVLARWLGSGQAIAVAAALGTVVAVVVVPRWTTRSPTVTARGAADAAA